ncbi:MAG: DNA-formamidopyrimidine glycosylase family protein [Myxococcales bacterium]|jgi:formamidopyrimidine-DNA glycosylase
MPELPDVTVYVERLAAELRGATLEGVRIRGPSLLRTAEPPLSDCAGRRVRGFSRLGKRIVTELEGEFFLVLHLMIAGRLRLTKPGVRIPGKIGLAAFDFDRATLLLTEASSHKRAQLHVVAGPGGLSAHDRGGLEVLEASPADFTEAVQQENHTLKRTLTDPRLLSGIGNAYSDEILHRARLSPVKLSQKLDDGEVQRLFEACRDVLREWTMRLREETGDGFPHKVTAFREGMAVHGRHGQPCPDCGSKVQRIVYAKNETNYCPACQTAGKLLADRSLSRLLKADWPRTPAELEEHMASRRNG